MLPTFIRPTQCDRFLELLPAMHQFRILRFLVLLVQISDVRGGTQRGPLGTFVLDFDAAQIEQGHRPVPTVLGPAIFAFFGQRKRFNLAIASSLDELGVFHSFWRHFTHSHTHSHFTAFSTGRQEEYSVPACKKQSVNLILLLVDRKSLLA